MKFLKKLLFIIFSFTIIFSCSKDSDSQGDNIPIRNSEIINYLNTPNSEGQLLSEVYIEEDKTTTYFYGSTDASGEGLLTKSLAYKVDDSERVEYVVLDELQRVKYIYSEVNGVKEKEIHSFTYPEEGIVNYIILKRDWTTLKDDILHFSTVETNGEEFIAHNLYGKGLKIKSPPEGDALLANVGTAVTVLAVVGTLLYAKAPGLARILAALAYTTAAIADEPPVVNNNTNAPSPPVTNIIDNQCTNSSLSVIIGVDPGNVLVAIVNGDSATYDFYWSTGETATTPITHIITAPDDGVYYVMVRDEKGCIAFASTSDNSGLKVGDLHEGGVIFYIDDTGEHGLVCSLKDQANEVQWGCDKVNLEGADGTAIGTGLQNTLDILAGCETSNIAARHAYSGDWFLPSYDELLEMAKNQQAIVEAALANGGEPFLYSFYYSSTETSSESVYLIHFGYDYSWGANPPPYYGYSSQQGPKWREVYNVRAVKAF